MLEHLLEKTSVFKLSLLRYICAPSTESRRIVGTTPRIWRAKFVDLITSMEETRDSTRSDNRGELSMEMAFALPLMMIVVLLQRLMRMEWDIEASISIGVVSLS